MARVVLNVDDSADDVMLLKLACATAKVSFRFESLDSGGGAIAYLQGMGEYADRGRFPLPSLVLLDLRCLESQGLTS